MTAKEYVKILLAKEGITLKELARIASEWNWFKKSFGWVRIKECISRRYIPIIFS